MPPTRSRARMKKQAHVAGPDTGTVVEAGEYKKPPPGPRETMATAPLADASANTSPKFSATSKKLTPRAPRIKCPKCTDYPDGFRSEHELRRHTNRVHRPTRKVWMTIDTSPDKSFLANCKACQTGKRYNECYNAASHLRRMHFHPHRRGERTTAEARRGGKPSDLDPPMEVLKMNWLREVDEVIGYDNELLSDVPRKVCSSTAPPQPQRTIAAAKINVKAPPTPTTRSTRSMAIESIVDKVDPF